MWRAPADPTGPPPRRFADRADAGRRLAERLLRDGIAPATTVLGLPRGGVPVAAEVARRLGARLDVLVVRKLGAPGEPELAMGAVGEAGAVVTNAAVVAAAGVGPGELAARVRTAQAQVAALAGRLRGDRPALPLAGPVVLVDDGVATGATVAAACAVARDRGAGSVLLAVPVAPQEALDRLAEVADRVVCLVAPRRFGSVGRWYRDFTATTEDEVRRLLHAGC